MRRGPSPALGAAAAVLLAALVPGISARAHTAAIDYSPRQLAALADHVVLAHVVASAARLTTAFYRVETVATVEVLECFKGYAPAGTTLDVSQPGGKVGPVHIEVQGTADLLPGADVLLFLSERGGVIAPISLGLSVYFVDLSGGGGTQVAREPLGVSRFVYDQAGRLVTPGPSGESYALAEIVAELHKGLFD